MQSKHPGGYGFRDYCFGVSLKSLEKRIPGFEGPRGQVVMDSKRAAFEIAIGNEISSGNVRVTPIFDSDFDPDPDFELQLSLARFGFGLGIWVRPFQHFT